MPISFANKSRSKTRRADDTAKRSPYLVPWEELPDRAREWNRSAVRSIPSLLASVNLAVVK